MHMKPHEPERPAPSYRTWALALVLLLLVWGFVKDRWTVRMASRPDMGRRVSQTVDVHPEVLNLQESFARVAEAVKPAVVNISTVHLEKYQANPYEFYFMEPEELFEQFFNSPHPQARP